MSEFDPIKSMREEVAGFRDAHAVILTRTREAERKFAEAEADYNALQKIESFAKHMLIEAQAKLTRLQHEAERK
jgi:phage terminase Nu1 subunit (DNA packaging protein)